MVPEAIEFGVGVIHTTVGGVVSKETMIDVVAVLEVFAFCAVSVYTSVPVAFGVTTIDPEVVDVVMFKLFPVMVVVVTVPVTVNESVLVAPKIIELGEYENTVIAMGAFVVAPVAVELADVLPTLSTAVIT